MKAELIALGRPQLDLTRYVRDYIDGLITVHSAFRLEAKGQRSSWEFVISGALASALKKWPEQSSRALELRAIRTSGSEIDSSYLARSISASADSIVFVASQQLIDSPWRRPKGCTMR